MLLSDSKTLYGPLVQALAPLYFNMVIRMGQEDRAEGVHKQLLNFWGGQLGLLMAECGESEITNYGQNILDCLTLCPRPSAKTSTARLLVKYASKSQAHAQSAKSTLQSCNPLNFETKAWWITLQILEDMGSAASKIDQLAAEILTETPMVKHGVPDLRWLQEPWVLEAQPDLAPRLLSALLEKAGSAAPVGWTCSMCTMENSMSTGRCTTCYQGIRPAGLRPMTSSPAASNQTPQDLNTVLMALWRSMPAIVQPWLNSNQQALASVSGLSRELLGMRPENDRQSLISDILALLVTYGAWYNNKRHWCFMAVQDGGCTTVSIAVDWILQNEPRLMQAGEADPAPGEDAAAPGLAGLVRVASSNTTNTRWQNMVNKKLFEACENGDKNLAQIREAIDWGADIDQRNGEGGVQGRCVG